MFDPKLRGATSRSVRKVRHQKASAAFEAKAKGKDAAWRVAHAPRFPRGACPPLSKSARRILHRMPLPVALAARWLFVGSGNGLIAQAARSL